MLKYTTLSSPFVLRHACLHADLAAPCTPYCIMRTLSRALDSVSASVGNVCGVTRICPNLFAARARGPRDVRTWPRTRGHPSLLCKARRASASVQRLNRWSRDVRGRKQNRTLFPRSVAVFVVRSTPAVKVHMYNPRATQA